MALLPCLAAAQSPSEATRDFALKVVATAGPQRSISLTQHNLSSMSRADFTALGRILADELQSNSMRITEPGAEVMEVQTTLSENLRGFLWVAQIRDGEKEQVVIESFARPEEPVAPPEKSVQIERKFVWQQQAPILDFLELASGRLLVLEPGRILRIDDSDSESPTMRAVPIPGDRPLARDPVGKLHRGEDGFHIYLPQTECSGEDPESSPLHCTQSAEGVATSLYLTAGWGMNVRFAPGRNSFVVHPEMEPEIAGRVPPLFSAAGLSEGEQSWMILAATDGTVRLYAEEMRPVAVLKDWGSQIAGIHSECGRNWQVLASRNTDSTQPDAIQVFEIAAGQPVAVGAAMEFPGPITALWTRAGGREAGAISRNLQTGRYEAYTLTLACR